MRNLFIFLFFIVFGNISLCAQDFDYQNAQFIRLSLTENKNMLDENELNNAILKQTNAIFCSCDFGKKIITVVMNKNESPDIIINALTDLGFSSTGLILKDYNDEYFIELYKNFRYTSPVEGSTLEKAETRNPEKDNVNFIKATAILNQ